jgi:hypothetical protein
MLKLPSIERLAQDAGRSLRRFPWVMAGAVACFGISCELIRLNDDSAVLWRLLLPCLLSLSLFFGLTVFTERRISERFRTFLPALGLIPLAIYYLSYQPDASTVYIYRFCQLALAFHLLVAVIPFLASGEEQGFWQYNRILFQRFLIGGFYAAVLYVGLALALSAVEHLLDVKLPRNSYGYVWAAVAMIFHPWFFISGIPKNWEDLDALNEYPAPLQVLVQYLLIPLVTLYLLILYLYTGKILIAQTWPKGTIANLVCGVSIFGILTMLLAYPLREKSTHAWVKRFTRWFYLALFPVIILMGMGLWRRISEYGITENRYVLVILSIWIAAMAGFFTWKRNASIKILPLSLALVALITSAGPWSAYAVSRSNQLRLLTETLGRLGILQGGKVTAVTSEVPFEDRKTISSITNYLVGSYGVKAVQPLFTQPLKGRDPAHGTPRFGVYRHDDNVSAEITKLMGIEYVHRWQTASPPDMFTFTVSDQEKRIREVGHYRYWVPLPLSYHTLAKEFTLDGRLYSVRLSTAIAPVLSISAQGQETLALNLTPLILNIRQGTTGTYAGGYYQIPASSMTVSGQSGLLRAKLFISQMTGKEDASAVNISSIAGDLFIDLKR